MGQSQSQQFEFSGTDRFEILRRLGAGGMGVVYEALDRESGQKVALKTLKTPSAQSLYQLKNEFRGLQDLQHRNLCGLGELLEESGQWFFTMELLAGVDFLTYVRGQDSASATLSEEDPTEELTGTLQQDCAPSKTRKGICPGFSEGRLRRALVQLAQGLGELHRCGKVHRDIKPSNIIVTKEGRLVLLDFGLATDSVGELDPEGDIDSLGNASSVVANVVGTVSYMSPEQAAQSEVGSPADWYAVGVMVYEAVTGQLPFQGKNVQVLLDKQEMEPPPPRTHVPALAESLDHLCRDMLHFDPRERPNAVELLRRLGVEEEAETIAASTSGPTLQDFVGRSEELGLLAQAFETTREGTPSSVVVFGESGLGKTALLIEATSRVLQESPETVVLRGRCYERESVPFKAFDGVVDALSRHLRTLSREEVQALLPDNPRLLTQVFPVLGRVEAFARAKSRGPEVREPHELRRSAFAALRQLFVRLTADSKVIVVIDDWQWADKDSEILLKDLLSSEGAPTLLLLVSARPEARTAFEGTSAFPDETQQIELAGLSAEAALELSSNLMRKAGVESIDVEELASEAQGHPLYIDAMVRHAARVGDNKAPLRLDDALAQRVSEFEPEARRVAELVCVAGEPIPQGVLRDAAEIDKPAYTTILSQLRVANTLRGRGLREASLVEPYHDRVREAVLATLDEEAQSSLHERLAFAIESAGMGALRPELLLRHLEASGQYARAAEHAIDAGDRASRVLAFERSADFYQTALRLGDFDAERTRTLRQSVATALANAGQGPKAAEAFMTAAEGGDAATRRNCQRQAAEQWLTSGHVNLGLEAMSALLNEIGVSMPATPQRALLSLLGNRVRLRLNGYRCTPRPESEIDPETLTQIDVLVAVSSGLNMVDMIMGANFQSQGLLLALRAGARNRTGRALVVEAAQVVSTGKKSDFKRAQELLAKVKDLSQGDPLLDAWVEVGEGAADYMCSYLITAEEHLERAEASLRSLPKVSWELGQLRVFRLSNLRRLGALVKMGELADEYLRDAGDRGDLYAQTSITLCCARVWLRHGDLEEARNRVASVSWTPPEEGYHLQHWYAFGAEIEFELYEGKTEGILSRWESHFVSLKKALLLRIMIVRTEASWIRGRLALASALHASPREAARLRKIAASMARSLKKEKDGFASVAALLLDATLANQNRDDAAARSALRQAISAADVVGMRLHAASARRRLGELLQGEEGDALLARGEQMMEDEGVADPVKMTEVYLPAFRPRKA
jgi:serine/threonine protein kinase/tetratricopeptide (TPR) repeat protein